MEASINDSEITFMLLLNIVHDQHIIIHVISAKIGAAGSKTPIFAT